MENKEGAFKAGCRERAGQGRAYLFFSFLLEQAHNSGKVRRIEMHDEITGRRAGTLLDVSTGRLLVASMFGRSVAWWVTGMVGAVPKGDDVTGS